MFLARVINLDEELLICDLAEYYSIYDYKRMPLDLIATLTYGLRNESRVKMALTNQKVGFDTMLFASMVDNLSMMVWMNTKDARDGMNKPKSILKELTGKNEPENKSFNSSDEFLEAFNKIAKG